MPKKIDDYKDFIDKFFFICPNCGYNNYKTKVRVFGTCLKCGSILNKQSYFRYKMMGKLGTLSKRKIK